MFSTGPSLSQGYDGPADSLLCRCWALHLTHDRTRRLRLRPALPAGEGRRQPPRPRGVRLLARHPRDRRPDARDAHGRATAAGAHRRAVRRAHRRRRHRPARRPGPGVRRARDRGRGGGRGLRRGGGLAGDVLRGVRPRLLRRPGGAGDRDRALRPGLRQRLLGRPPAGLRRRRRQGVRPVHQARRRARPRADARGHPAHRRADLLRPVRCAQRVGLRRVRLLPQAAAARPDRGRGRLADRRGHLPAVGARPGAALDGRAGDGLRRPGARQGPAGRLDGRLRRHHRGQRRRAPQLRHPQPRLPPGRDRPSAATAGRAPARSGTPRSPRASAPAPTSRASPRRPSRLPPSTATPRSGRSGEAWATVGVEARRGPGGAARRSPSRPAAWSR